MSDPRFFYSPEIETKIPQLIKKTLSLDVLSSTKITEGEENHVYLVVAPKKKIILRILGTPYWAGGQKLSLLSKKLEQNAIPFPKLLYCSLTAEDFPYGYMINEYIEGENSKEAIEKGSITFEAFHRKLFQLLRRVHSVTNQEYNFLNDTGFDSLIDFKLDQMNWCFAQLTEQVDVYEKKDEVKKILTKVLTPLQHKIQPVLIHYDPMPSNCMYTPEGELILIDWDSAASECFMRDIAWITYWSSQEQRQELWKLFFTAYADCGFSEKELVTIEQLYHLLIAVELLAYFLKSQKNIQGYEETKKRFLFLLTQYAT